MEGNKTANCSVTVVKNVTVGLPQTGYDIDAETLVIAGAIMIITGLAVIKFRRKES